MMEQQSQAHCRLATALGLQGMLRAVLWRSSPARPPRKLWTGCSLPQRGRPDTDSLQLGPAARSRVMTRKNQSTA